jgi:hypothetical protein
MGPSIRLWSSIVFYFLPLSTESKCTVKMQEASVAYTDSGGRTGKEKKRKGCQVNRSTAFEALSRQFERDTIGVADTLAEATSLVNRATQRVSFCLGAVNQWSCVTRLPFGMARCN